MKWEVDPGRQWWVTDMEKRLSSEQREQARRDGFRTSQTVYNQVIEMNHAKWAGATIVGRENVYYPAEGLWTTTPTWLDKNVSFKEDTALLRLLVLWMRRQRA